jgi:apolipoprotein N-acyltransferase
MQLSHWFNLTTRPPLISFILNGLAGASMVLAFAPFDLYYFIIPGLLWLLWDIKALSPLACFWHCLWFFGGFFGAGISWVFVSINTYGNANLIVSVGLTTAMVLLLALVQTIPFALMQRYCAKALSHRAYYLLFVPSAFVLIEWLRSFIFSGFPWLYLGHSQIDSLLGGWAPVLGSLSMSFLLYLSAGCLYLLIGTALTKRTKGQLIGSLALLLSILASSFVLNSWQWVKVTDKQLRVSLIQPSVPQELKWMPEQRVKTLQYLEAKTKTLDSQLVIWPEAAVPALKHQVTDYLERVSAHALQREQAVITGIVVKEQDKKLYNATIALGTAKGSYYKQHLVPFGEYMPLKFMFQWLLDFLHIPMSNFTQGSDQQLGHQLAGWNIGMAICYEIIFPNLVARQIKDKDLLITVSNDAWFGDSIGPYQHMQIARVRAKENGIPVIRATNDGISGFINHQGQLISSMAKFQRGSLTAEIHAVTGETPYRLLGPNFSLMLILLVPMALLGIALKKSLL